MIGNKIAAKITKVSRSSLQNSSETVTNETEIAKEIYVSRKKKVIDDLRFILYYDNGISKIVSLLDNTWN